MANKSISRMVPPVSPRLSGKVPEPPRLADVCPDMVRRFPELLKYDQAWQEWRRNIRQVDLES